MSSRLKLAAAEVALEKRPDGSMLLRSPQKLGAPARCVTEWLLKWSDATPTKDFLCERRETGWRRVSYREAYGAARRIGQGLLDIKLGAEKPLAILSDNGVDHALLA